MYYDSTGKPVSVGDQVLWRGKEYTIKSFLNNGAGTLGTSQIEFEEEKHLSEIPDEISIDKI